MFPFFGLFDRFHSAKPKAALMCLPVALGACASANTTQPQRCHAREDETDTEEASRDEEKPRP